MNRPLRPWIFAMLHVLLALSLPLAFSLMLGCMKAKARPADFGPEVDAEKVNKALQDATANADISSIHKGQSITLSTTRRIENEDSTIDLASETVEVADQKDTATESDFTLLITKSLRQPDNSWETTTSEQQLALEKPSSVLSSLEISPLAVSPQALTAESLARRVHSLDEEKKPVREAYYNLQVSDGTIDAPDALQAKPDCGGLKDCELHVKFVQFDIVDWYADNSYDKYSFDFAFTNEPPYLPFGTDIDQFTGLLALQCQSYYVPIDSASVYVRDCTSLTDFQK